MSEELPEPQVTSEAPAWKSVLFWTCFSALLAFHFVANVWWQTLDNRPVRTDEEVHMQAARDYYEAFTLDKHDSALKRLIAISEVRPKNPVHPPLLHVAGALCIMALGYSSDHIALTSTFFYLLLLLGCYALARRFLSPWQALFCVFVISFTPIIYGSSRFFMTDFASLAITVWAIYALLRTDYFSNPHWVFVFAVLNGLGILTRTVTFLFYLVPCLLLVLAGLMLAFHAADRGAAFRRWLFNCTMTLVVSVGVFGPWYFHNIGYYYNFWVEDHLGGHGGPIVQFDEAGTDAGGEYFPERMERPTEPADESPAAAASSEAEGDAGMSSAAAAAGPAQPERPIWLGKILRPRVHWSRYVVYMLNNALFLPLSLLSVLGMFSVLLLKRYRNQTNLVLLLSVLSSWVLMTLLIKYSNPRYALPVIPALSLFAALAVLAIPWRTARTTAIALLCLILVLQYVHLSFRTLGPYARLDVPVKIEEDSKKFRDPGIVMFKDEMLISDAFAPVGHPMLVNFKDRVFATLLEAERRQPILSNADANFQRLNLRGFEFDQKHYWPEPNPYLRKDLPADLIPKRRLRSVGMGHEPEHLLPRLGITDYIVYAIEPGLESKEKEWQQFFVDRGFVLFNRFDFPSFGSVPPRTYGIMMRVPEGAMVRIEGTADIDGLSLLDLYEFIHSSTFPELSPEMKDYSRARFEQLVQPHAPFYAMNESASLVSMTVGKVEPGWYELRILFKVTASFGKDYRMLFNTAPDDPQYLPEDKRAQGYADWNFSPVPPTSEWKTGDYMLLRRRFPAHPVPHRLAVLFFEPPDKAIGVAAQSQVDLSQVP